MYEWKMKKICFFMPCVVFILSCSDDFPRIDGYTPNLSDGEEDKCADLEVPSNYYCDSKTGDMGPNMCLDFEDNDDILCDVRDGKKYKFVYIGSQVWMAKNLDYDTQTPGSKCCTNYEGSCEKYGRLYNFDAAKRACPPDWHLPSNNEWLELINAVLDKDHHPTEVLKAKEGWEVGNNGVDTKGFSALPGGQANGQGYCTNYGTAGVWRISDDVTSSTSYGMTISNTNSVQSYSLHNDILASVRCVKDDN